MSHPRTITIVALTGKSGNPGFISAGKMLCDCLTEAARTPWQMRLHLSSIGGEFPLSPAPTAIIACPGWQEAERVEEPFARTETRWRSYLTGLQAHGAPVFICTIFRHIQGRLGMGFPSPTLERIRRLNRMAAELSRDLGVAVIDIDRAFAHPGGQKLQTDYRLSGVLAAEFAGHTIAWSLLSGGLDEAVDPELQESARKALGGLYDLIRKQLDRPGPYSPPGPSARG